MSDPVELAVRTPLPPSSLHLAAEASTSTLHLPHDLPPIPKAEEHDNDSILTLTPDDPTYENENRKYESSLAPVDGGFAAWSLVSSFHHVARSTNFDLLFRSLSARSWLKS